MTGEQREELNRFFVHVFNRILAWEERALSDVGAKDLSVKELHVLEAVYDMTAEGRNTMTQVADSLSVRVSTLTTAVNTLVRKGYLDRGGQAEDRRVTRVFLTPKGKEANRLHAQFHRQMIEEAAARLDGEELEVLLRSLRELDRFFQELSGQKE